MQSRNRLLVSVLLSGAAACAVVGARIVPASEVGPAATTLLRGAFGFSADDLRALGAGSAVIRSLDTPVREELAHVAAVLVDAPPERFLERFRNIVDFERGPGVPQIGRFSSPPRVDDLSSLTLPPEDLASLRSCRPGHCDVKLSAEMMRRFRSSVGWSSPDAALQATAIAREVFVDLIRAYQESGNSGLGAYEDSGEPLSVAGQFEALLASDVPVAVPALISYLKEYPHNRPAGLEDFFYWTVVDFGLKPTIRLNHVMIYRLESSARLPASHVIAIKQLYASHYFFTTLELRFLIEDGGAGGDRLALVSVTRSRNDGMTGFKGLFLRPIIARRSREGVRVYLEHVKRQMETPVAGL